MAVHAPITGAPTRATLIPFPNREGTGFRYRGKQKDCDLTNVAAAASMRAAKGIVRVEESFSAEMILVHAILAQLTAAQRRAAQNEVHRFHQEIGTAQSRAASAFMAGVR